MSAWRDLFDIPDDVAYFNCASAGPLMRKARLAIDESAARRTRPWLLTTEHWVGESEERRRLLATLIGTDADSIALVPAVSYGVAVAARNLRAAPGSRVVLVADDFPSDVYSWRAFAASTGAQIATVTKAAGQNWTQAVLAQIDERCAIVATPNVHWTNGGLFDLHAIGTRCREVGARLVVDASQSLGVMSLDFAAVRPDFVVAVGYKWLLGPFGLGYLYVGPEHRDGVPLEHNWIAREGSEDFSRLVDYVERYRPGARRFDVGERSELELTGAACVALRQMHEWTPGGIAAHLKAITASIETRANQLGLTVSDPNRGPHLLGLDLPERSMPQVSEILRAANVFVSVRGKSLRIAPHMYTTSGDLERLFAAMKKIAAIA